MQPAIFVSALCAVVLSPLLLAQHTPERVLYRRTDNLLGNDFGGVLPGNVNQEAPFGELDDPDSSLVEGINVDREPGALGVDLLGDNYDLTFIFQFYDADGIFSFTENFDDRVKIVATPVTGSTKLTATGAPAGHSDVGWNTRTYANYDFGAGGWFNVDIWLTEDRGGAQSAADIGFGYFNGNSTNTADFGGIGYTPTFGTSSGVPAAFDTDDNGQSWGAYIDTFDPNVDTDGDSIPDGYEEQFFPGDLTQLGPADFDGDGVNDPDEYVSRTDPTAADSDDDGVNDGDEASAGTDPLNADSDGDSLLDGVETNTGTFVNANDTGTDPLTADTDGDGLPDGVEDPNLSFVDASQPGTDPNNRDTDGDFTGDGAEINQGRDPTLSDGRGGDAYVQDFDGFPDGTTDLGDGTVLRGTAASVQGGRLQLTIDNQSLGFSSFSIPALEGSSEGWTATFDLELYDSPGGNVPADGFSFNYGNAALGERGQAEEGMANRPGVTDNLSFEIDTWWNGGGEQGLNISGLAEGAGLGELAFTNGVILNDGQRVTGTVDINWDPDYGASFTTTGLETNATFTNVNTAAFQGDDEFTFVISARAGGANQDLFIDNLTVITGPPGDRDNDGLSDTYEVANGLDPGDDGTTGESSPGAKDGPNGAFGDPDGDGLTNTEERDLGTNPQDDDSDGDGLLDGVETNTGTLVDANDTGSNPLEVDTDGDGFEDAFEIANLSNPNDGNDIPDIDPNLLIAVDATNLGLADGAVVDTLSNPGFAGDFSTLIGQVETVSHSANNNPGASIQGLAFNGDKMVSAKTLTSTSMTGNQTYSVTAWVYNQGFGAEEAIVSWGHRGGPNGSNSGFHQGNHSTFGAIGHWGGGALGNPNQPSVGWGARGEGTDINATAGQWAHLAYVWDGRENRVFINGVFNNSEAHIALNPHQSYGDGTPTVFALGSESSAGSVNSVPIPFSGTIARVRAEDIARTDAQILDAFNAERSLFFDGAAGDSDGDGLADDVETGTGIFVDASDTGTDPNNPDSDGDGLGDGDEVADGSDPLDFNSPQPSGHVNGRLLYRRTDGLNVGGDEFTGVLPENIDQAPPFGELDDPNSSLVEGINVDREPGALGVDLLGDNYDLTFIFQFYDADGVFSFTENFDDRVKIVATPVTGSTNLTATEASAEHSDAGWNTRTYANFDFGGGGWFNIDLWLVEDGGGAHSAGDIGFGYFNGNSSVLTDFGGIGYTGNFGVSSGASAVFDTDANGQSWGVYLDSFVVDGTAAEDSDDDGLADDVETGTGTFVDAGDTGTDPNNPDSDGDGLSDGLEVTNGSDPNDATSPPPVDVSAHTPERLLYHRTDGLPGADFTGTLPDNIDRDPPFGELDDPGSSLVEGINVDREPGALGVDLLGDNYDLTFIFQFYDADGIFSFTENFDDRVKIVATPVTGSTKLTATGASAGHSDVGWNTRTYANFDFGGGGWFNIDLWLVEDGGHAQSAGDIGLGYVNRNSSDLSDFGGIGYTPTLGVSSGAPAVFDTDANGQSWGVYLDSFDPNLDTDGDSIPDGYEELFFPGNLTQLGPGDFDGDGVNDPDEYTDGTDPTDADSDNDGSNDGAEAANSTDPLDPDSDDDGLLDGVETNTRTFVNANDTGTDPLDTDSDDDSIFDGAEVTAGLDPTVTDSADSDDLTWTIIDGEVRITDCNETAAGNLVIPATIDDNPVTSIGNKAFYGCNYLTNVMIPESVTTLGNLAFFGCSSLASIEIPKGVTNISAGAFRGCSSLASIEIPEGVTNIPAGAFRGCSSLTSVMIPERVTNLGTDAFRGCSSLANVTIPESVTTLGDGVFFNCTSLTSIEIPDSVTSMGTYVLGLCENLTEVTLGSGVTDLRDGFFRWCRTLTRVIFSGPAPTVVGSNVFDGLPEEAVVIVSGEEHASFGDVGADWNGLSIVCNSSALCWLTWTMTDGEVSITDCNEAATGELVIPDTIGGNPVTSIGDAAFADCSALESITIPDSVTTIGDAAFAGCSALERITFSAWPSPIASAPTTVGVDAFLNTADGAVAIILGNGLASFGEAGATWNGLTLVDGRGLPANDDFSNPQVITGISGDVSGRNVFATLESAEPTTTDGFLAGSSVWFSWEAPATGTFSFRLTADFDAQLAIFTGEDVGALTVHGEANTRTLYRAEEVALATNEGTNYWVRVTGDSTQSGEFLLDWDEAPANDDFSNPQVITEIEVEGSVAGSNEFATLQPGEPTTTSGWSSGSSVWFSWEAPATGTFSFRLRAGFDAQLAIFTGEHVGILTLLDESDPEAWEADSVVTLPAVAGANYWVRVTGVWRDQAFWPAVAKNGLFTLEWSIRPVYQHVYTFEASAGRIPTTGLVHGSDGNFYGTTSVGGAYDVGTVYKMTPGGVLTTLVEFTGAEGPYFGATPRSLMQGQDGNFYGMTSREDGIPGTIFKVTPEGVFTTLWQGYGGSTFDLVQDRNGNFYGTTGNGGARNLGTVFKMTPAGEVRTLVQFTGTEGPNKGGKPGGLVLGNDGDIYGVTRSGGTGAKGTVFKMTPSGVLTTLVEFTGPLGNDNTRGVRPKAALVQVDGDFYGTTAAGGTDGKGTVFRMTPAGVLTTLADFTGIGGAYPGHRPAATLVRGNDGNLYGTTEDGGADDKGTAFKMTPEGVLTTLFEFGESETEDSGTPLRLVLSNDGNFYGATVRGGSGARDRRYGSGDVGTVFKMTPEGVLTTLVDFAQIGVGSIGASPAAALVQGSDGDFYGTTKYDGATDSGTVFRMTPAGVPTRLVDFTGLEGDNKGKWPQADLVKGSDGDFYGTTYLGGVGNAGTVFRMTPEGALTTLVEFGRNPNKGSYPQAALVEGSDGDFYGTTEGGALFDAGTVFKITPEGALTTLVEFGRNSNIGKSPQAALVEGSDGNFYGTTAFGGASDNGTVFRMTPAGVLTTLVEFTGIVGDNKGAKPLGALVVGSDGSFYGTTEVGGAGDKGTVFTMTPEEALTTLFEFGGSETEDNGSHPQTAMVQLDGDFYGTTRYGGADDNGTVFTMTPAGVVTTFYEFRSGGSPVGPLVAGSDGDLYGAFSAFGTSGGIYRLVFRGVPTAYLLAPPRPPEGLTSTSAVLQSIVNPRGAVVDEVRIEYGIDGVTFPNTVIIPITLTGYQGINIGRTVSDLTLGTTYYYRFRVTSSAGETVSPVQSFSTLAEPTVAIVPASEITPGSARLNGLVNARNFDATVIFEYGPDGNSFPGLVTAEPAMVTGSEDKVVSAQIAGLDAGHTYYYRLVASNTGGTVVSGQGSFRTLTEPVAVLGGASALSTTRARVDGSVDARGSDAVVDFEYWSEEETSAEAIKVPATPAAVSGEGSIEVQATLTGLAQGTTYHYRIRAVGPGGTGLSETGTFSLSLLSGLDQTFPDPPTSATGEVTVNIAPPDTGGWRFAGERQWRVSGEIVANLASGDRLVEFRPVPGYIHPPTELVGLTSSDPERVLEGTYFQTLATGTGTLTVHLKPDNLAGAQWRLSGETDWRDGEVEIGGLVPGTYLVESKPVADRVTPPTTSVTIEDGVPGVLTLTYFHANNPTGEGAGVVSFTEVSNNEDLPLAYLGQIRSPVGSSTGFVVKRRVVATAGHVVFDDGSLSFILDLQWLFQRHSSEHEPRPQTPRGFYLAAGYAEARQADGVEPGVGTPESQDLDYAVLYFQEEAGRGGVGGFLASEAMDENEFLSSSAEKMLAGYPVDGIPESDLGKVHATPIFTDALIPAFGETWTTSAVYGVGGISGGPLFARHSNGAFYPAAIYLGGAGQAVVRAIDSDVVNLFLRAEASGNGGENNTGGGITHTSVAGNISATDPGALRVVIEPASATALGAGWQLVPESTWRQGGALKSGLSAGTYNLVFNPIDGFEAPEMQAVEVTGGQLTTVTFTYEGGGGEHLNSPLETWRQDNFGTISDSGDAADDADPDGDGVTNINEYTAGTDPLDGDSFFEIILLTRAAVTELVTVTWSSIPGRSYTLQKSVDLSPGSWDNIATGIIATGATTSLLDPSADDQSRMFYRVGVE